MRIKTKTVRRKTGVFVVFGRAGRAVVSQNFPGASQEIKFDGQRPQKPGDPEAIGPYCDSKL